MLQLHFDPHLANIRPAFLTREKAIVKQIVARSKSPSLRQIQNQLEYQGWRSGVEMRIFLQRFHPFAGGPIEQAERLIDAQIIGNVRGIASQSVAESGQSACSGSFLI